jgi:hypothetical protein
LFLVVHSLFIRKIYLVCLWNYTNTKTNIIMAVELNLDALKDMKKAEFVKAFKNKAAWKKASAVILLSDYKLDGKKATVAIPFRKVSEMKAEMKRLKKEKLHLMKKSGGGTFSIEKGPNGVIAKIELLMGGLAPQALEGKITELFAILKIGVHTTQSEAAAAEAAATPAEADPNENLLADGFADVAADADDDNDDMVSSAEEVELEQEAEAEEPIEKKRELKPEKKAKMVENMKKMKENLDKIIKNVSDLKANPNE